MISVGLVADHTHEAPLDHTGIRLPGLPMPHAHTGHPCLPAPLLCATGSLEKCLEAPHVVDPWLALLLPGAQLEPLEPGHACLSWERGWGRQRGRTLSHMLHGQQGLSFTIEASVSPSGNWGANSSCWCGGSVPSRHLPSRPIGHPPFRRSRYYHFPSGKGSALP